MRDGGIVQRPIANDSRTDQPRARVGRKKRSHGKNVSVILNVSANVADPVFVVRREYSTEGGAGRAPERPLEVVARAVNGAVLVQSGRRAGSRGLHCCHVQWEIMGRLYIEVLSL